MDHPGDGPLQTYLDRELDMEAAEAVERHLLRCPECQERLDELDHARETVSAALAELDPPAGETEDLDAARWEVRKRYAGRRGQVQRQRLATAAVVVLLLGAGVASAMPGSPIRDWLVGDEPAESAVEVVPEEAGAALAVELENGEARVELRELGAGVTLEVRMHTDERLEVEAPVGARFETGAGWIRVSGGHEEGTMRIRIPEEAREVEVTVDGATRVELREGRLLVDGSEVEAARAAGGWLPVPVGS